MQDKIEIKTLKSGRKGFIQAVEEFKDTHESKIQELVTKYGAKNIVIGKIKVRTKIEWLETDDGETGWGEPEIEILKVKVSYLTQYGYKEKAIVIVPDNEY